MRLDSAPADTDKNLVPFRNHPLHQLRRSQITSSQSLVRNIALVAMVSLSLFAINDFLAGMMTTVYVFVFNVFVVLPLVFFLISRNQLEIAKGLILLLLNVCVLIADISTPYDDGVRFFFIPVGLIALMFYDINERVKLAYGLLLPLVGFGLSIPPELHIAPEIENVHLSLELSKTINFIGIYGVTIAEILVFVRYIRDLRVEAALHAKFSSLGILSSGIAHEINNPLSIIKGRAEILQHKINVGADPTALKNEAVAIGKTVDRISRIVKGFRIFTRDSSADPFQPVPATIIVETAMDLCFEKIERAGIKVDVRMHHELVVQGLETQLIQVLVNLMNNARDAVENTPDAWIRIDVLKDRITVTDSGTGIPHQIVDQIMLPFFTTKGANQGSGLGLSICKGILEFHGGELFLDRRAPNTCFVMKFRST